MDKNLTVGLIVGGASPERAVSKLTGEGVYKALVNLGYGVKLVDPAYGRSQPTKIEDYFSDCESFPVAYQNYPEAINSELLDDIDLAFIALHGSWGEDGTIQSLLEFRDIPYTGSGILACAASMDKGITKSIIQHHDVPTPHWIVVEKDQYNQDELITEIKSKFNLPFVVKPNDQGSAIGLTICKNFEELNDAIKLSHQFSKKALIEEYIDGREVTVGVIGEKVLPVLEIKPKHFFYDYECKYTSGMSEYEVPADIPEEVSLRIQNYALDAYKAVGCSSYGRLDFRLDKDLNPFCLEINTLPGLTSTSLLPKAAKSIGMNYDQLIELIIKNSLS
ncbi:MAG: D-alanine--D-alanine ligase [Bacteroidota bacterium]